MKALDNIMNRVSARSITEPHPTKQEMEKVYKAALRAPDHAWLRPTSFIEVKDKGLNKLSSVFSEFAQSLSEITPEIAKKYTNAPFRAPMILILVSTYREHPKVPAIEQKLSTAAAAQNILLALNSMGYSAIWRTGKLAFNPFIESKLGLMENQKILGYLYIGTSEGKNKKVPELELSKFVKEL